MTDPTLGGAVPIVDAAASGRRLTTLQALRDDLAARLEACTSDQNYATLGRLLSELLVQIDDLGGGVAEPRTETALDEFTKRLADRQSAPARSRRAAVR